MQENTQKIIKIRRFTITDISKNSLTMLGGLMSQLISDHLKIKETKIRYALEDHDFILLVAEHDGTIIGTATLFFQWKPDGKELAEIHDIVVDKNYRGEKIGRKLMDELLKYVKERVMSTHLPIKIMLTSAPSRVEANSMYQKFGFELAAKAEGQHGTNLYRMIVEPR